MCAAGRQPISIPVDTATWGGPITAVDALSGKSESWTGAAQVALGPEQGRIYQLKKN